jgi:bifunctional non-homologous end joining protein LigD
LHYDFRLEIGDVLKSWAIPKGPSMDPSLKRLAIEVEDHPLSYMHFEGTIPEGQYGAGEVIIWDRGEYYSPRKEIIVEQYEKGDMEFFLDGKKLKGLFRMIGMKGKDMPGKWLLLKKHDMYISDRDILREKPGSVVSLRRLADD